jgi:hypothetical protein
MATAIKSGSVSVDIIGNDNDIQQKIKRVQNKFLELGKTMVLRRGKT